MAQKRNDSGESDRSVMVLPGDAELLIKVEWNRIRHKRQIILTDLYSAWKKVYFQDKSFLIICSSMYLNFSLPKFWVENTSRRFEFILKQSGSCSWKNNLLHFQKPQEAGDKTATPKMHLTLVKDSVPTHNVPWPKASGCRELPYGVSKSR